MEKAMAAFRKLLGPHGPARAALPLAMLATFVVPAGPPAQGQRQQQIVVRSFEVTGPNANGSFTIRFHIVNQGRGQASRVIQIVGVPDDGAPREIISDQSYALLGTDRGPNDSPNEFRQTIDRWIPRQTVPYDVFIVDEPSLRRRIEVTGLVVEEITMSAGPAVELGCPTLITVRVRNGRLNVPRGGRYFDLRLSDPGFGTVQTKEQFLLDAGASERRDFVWTPSALGEAVISIGEMTQSVTVRAVERCTPLPDLSGRTGIFTPEVIRLGPDTPARPGGPATTGPPDVPPLTTTGGRGGVVSRCAPGEPRPVTVHADLEQILLSPPTYLPQERFRIDVTVGPMAHTSEVLGNPGMEWSGAGPTFDRYVLDQFCSEAVNVLITFKVTGLTSGLNPLSGESNQIAAVRTYSVPETRLETFHVTLGDLDAPVSEGGGAEVNFTFQLRISTMCGEAIPQVDITEFVGEDGSAAGAGGLAVAGGAACPPEPNARPITVEIDLVQASASGETPLPNDRFKIEAMVGPNKTGMQLNGSPSTRPGGSGPTFRWWVVDQLCGTAVVTPIAFSAEPLPGAEIFDARLVSYVRTYAEPSSQQEAFTLRLEDYDPRGPGYGLDVDFTFVLNISVACGDLTPEVDTSEFRGE